MTLLNELRSLLAEARQSLRGKWNRRVSTGDLLTDRWELAKEYGWGEGTSCYDNVLVIGDVKVGRNTWIGPNCYLDGSGGLEIGDNCAISAGVQIYSHDTVQWAITMGAAEYEYAPTKIGSGVYIGPQAVVSKGVVIGDSVVIGAHSLVLSDVPSGCRAHGCPARIVRSPQS